MGESVTLADRVCAAAIATSTIVPVWTKCTCHWQSVNYPQMQWSKTALCWSNKISETDNLTSVLWHCWLGDRKDIYHGCRAVNGTAPAYLSSCFTRVADMSSQQRLRSTSTNQPAVPLFNLSTVGKWTFPVSGTSFWNNLPLHVTSAPSLAIFRQRRHFSFTCHIRTWSSDLLCSTVDFAITLTTFVI